MRPSLASLVTLFCSVALSAVAVGQAPADVMQLHRDALLQTLVTANPDVARAMDAVRRAQMQRRGTYGILDPIFDAQLDLQRAVTPTDTGNGQFSAINDRFSLSAGITRTFAPGTRVGFTLSQALTRSEVPLRAILGPDVDDLVDVGPERIQNVETSMALTVTQPLLQGLGRDNVLIGELMAAHSVRTRELEVHQIASTRAVEVLNTYAELRYAQEEVALRERSLQRSEAQLLIAQAEAEAGQIAPIEVDLVREQVAARQEALLVSTAEQARRARQLAQLLGLPADTTTPLVAMDPFITPPQVSFSPLLCDEVAENSADVAVLMSQVRLAETRTDMTADALRPSLEAMAGVTQSGLDPSWSQSLSEAITFDAPTLFGGLVFRTPLRNRTARAEHDVAQAEVSAAEFEVDELERGLCFQAREAVEALSLLRARSEIAVQRVDLATRALAADDERFVSGLSTVQAGIDVRENLEAAESSLLRLRVDAEVAWWQLQHLRGRVLDAAALAAP